jgi:HSP20 family protein
MNLCIHEVTNMKTQELTKREPATVARRQEPVTFVPAADIWETEHEVVLRLDMPGVAKDGVEVKVERDTLNVHGKVAPAPAGTALYSEQRIGDFQRQFNLSDDLNRDAISAEMDAGVLTIRIAKAEAVKPRTIQIRSSN